MFIASALALAFLDRITAHPHKSSGPAPKDSEHAKKSNE
jgi:hypothetical protein